MEELCKHWKECEVGDSVTRDVIDFKTGVVLCGRGHILTDESLIWLKKFEVSELYVQKRDWGANLEYQSGTYYEL